MSRVITYVEGREFILELDDVLYGMPDPPEISRPQSDYWYDAYYYRDDVWHNDNEAGHMWDEIPDGMPEEIAREIEEEKKKEDSNRT